MTSIGIKVNGDNVPATKDQLVRLAFSSFTMIMKNDGQTFFKQDRLIEGGIFPEQDLDHYAAGRFGKMRWPTGVELSQKAYDRFIQHAIPVPTARLAEIANSAMAIDIFMYLCYRLPLIPSGESEPREGSKSNKHAAKQGESCCISVIRSPAINGLFVAGKTAL
jgi:hypothetical protein